MSNHPPHAWLKKYEEWCKLPLLLRLNTPLEVPLYQYKSNGPGDSTKPNQNQSLLSGSAGRGKLSDLGYYSIVSDIIQIVKELQSKVNKTEIEMEDKESEYNSNIQVVRRYYEVQIDKLTAELNQKSTLIDELRNDVDDEIKGADMTF